MPNWERQQDLEEILKSGPGFSLLRKPSNQGFGSCLFRPEPEQVAAFSGDFLAPSLLFPRGSDSCGRGPLHVGPVVAFLRGEVP